MYFSKFLSLNSAVFCKNGMCYRIAVNGIQKFRLFSIRNNENLKIKYFYPIFKKWLYLNFPRSTKWSLFLENATYAKTAWIWILKRRAMARCGAIFYHMV